MAMGKPLLILAIGNEINMYTFSIHDTYVQINHIYCLYLSVHMSVHANDCKWFSGLAVSVLIPCQALRIGDAEAPTSSSLWCCLGPTQQCHVGDQWGSAEPDFP